MLPSSFDEAATERFLEKLEELRPIAKRRKPVAILGNRIRPGTRAADRLEAFFVEIGHPVIARLRDSQAYVEAAGSGPGLLILDGLMGVDARVDNRTATELVGTGDLLQADIRRPDDLLRRTDTWRALYPTRFALLDEEFADRMRP